MAFFKRAPPKKVAADSSSSSSSSSEKEEGSDEFEDLSPRDHLKVWKAENESTPEVLAKAAKLVENFKPHPVYGVTSHFRDMYSENLIADDDEAGTWVPCFNIDLWHIIISYIYKQTAWGAEVQPQTIRDRVDLYRLAHTCRSLRYLGERVMGWDGRETYVLTERLYAKRIVSEDERKARAAFLEGLDMLEMDQVERSLKSMHPEHLIFDPNAKNAFVASHRILLGNCMRTVKWGNHDWSVRYTLPCTKPDDTPSTWISLVTRPEKDNERSLLIMEGKAGTPKPTGLEIVAKLPVEHAYRVLACLGRLIELGWCRVDREPLITYSVGWCEGNLEYTLVLVKGLLDRGWGNVNMGNRSNGTTALHRAVENRQPRLVKLLLEHGADPEVGIFRDVSPQVVAGTTPRDLLEAMRGSHSEEVQEMFRLFEEYSRAGGR